MAHQLVIALAPFDAQPAGGGAGGQVDTAVA